MRRLLALLLLLLSTAPLSASEPDLGPFQALASIPSDVDAAAVFENPAEALLLSPVGRSLRSLLAMGGVFTQTERAWQALADAFDAPIDETIRDLLSKRVAVVWDGFERGDASMKGLTNSIDTRWTLICEVEPDYLNAIRAAMRPVKRDIAHGRAVYAIEQGRYRLALLDSPKPGVEAVILLAPRSGAQLLDQVLAQMVNRKDPVNQAITAGHEDMLTELTEAHLAKGDGSWSFAFMTRVDLLATLVAQRPDQAGTNNDNQAFAGMVKLEANSMHCSFASNMPIDPSLPDAPLALYEAVSDDAILAIACARTPQVNIEDNAFQLSFSYATNPASPNASTALDADTLFQSPGLILVTPAEDGNSMGICVALEEPNRPDAQTALIADQTMHAIISSYDPAQAPRFEGRLPAVTRSLTLHQRSKDAGTLPSNWPGLDPRIAWSTLPTPTSDLFIASMTPNAADPTQQINTLEQAASALRALGPQSESGTLLRAKLRPPQLITMLGQDSLMDLALSKLVNEMDIEIRRGLRLGIRGQLNIEFANARPSSTNTKGNE